MNEYDKPVSIKKNKLKFMIFVLVMLRNDFRAAERMF